MPPDETQSGNAASVDRWHTQSILGGGDVPPEERGDCVRASITSILGLPLDAIENVHGDEWWDRLNAEVARFGYALAMLDTKAEPPRCYWIATVPSLNLGPDPDGFPAWHCVIARGYDLVHDPGMVKPGYTPERFADAWAKGFVAEGWALVQLDPAEGVA